MVLAEWGSARHPRSQQRSRMNGVFLRGAAGASPRQSYGLALWTMPSATAFYPKVRAPSTELSTHRWTIIATSKPGRQRAGPGTRLVKEQVASPGSRLRLTARSQSLALRGARRFVTRLLAPRSADLADPESTDVSSAAGCAGVDVPSAPAGLAFSCPATLKDRRSFEALGFLTETCVCGGRVLGEAGDADAGSIASVAGLVIGAASDGCDGGETVLALWPRRNFCATARRACE